MRYLYPCSILLLVACGLGSGDRTTDPSDHGTFTTGSGSSAETNATASLSDATADETSATSGSLGLDASTPGGQSTSSTNETSSGDTNNSETDPLPAICGNGIVEEEETCDDGNDVSDDGCQECAKDSIVFVSSESYQGYTLQGLYGADQRCRSLAGKAGHQNHLTFKAWLSDSTSSAIERLAHSRGRYILVNGVVVAQNWDALVSGMLDNPIIVDESSQTKDDPVWTGTFFNGEPAPDSKFCDDWKDSGAFEFAGIGSSMSVDGTWSFFDYSQCASDARIYCIEQ